MNNEQTPQIAQNPPCFIHSVGNCVLFHGSPIKIKDVAMASGTYFTEDIEIAKEYGRFVYSIQLDDKLRTLFSLDILGEHYISNRLIPFYMFEIEEF
jgi:hypothetical protein